MDSHWHFGVVKHEERGQVLYSMAEIYYHKGEKPFAWGRASLSDWEDPTEIEWCLEKMQSDWDKYPIFEYPKDFEDE